MTDKILVSREEIEAGAESLERYLCKQGCDGIVCCNPDGKKALTAFRAALSAPVQQQVAWVGELSEGADITLTEPQLYKAIPLYTHPAPAYTRRCWINQPASTQPLHHLHGVRVLATKDYGDLDRVYFLDGEVISQVVPRLALAEGWPAAGNR